MVVAEGVESACVQGVLFKLGNHVFRALSLPLACAEFVAVNSVYAFWPMKPTNFVGSPVMPYLQYRARSQTFDRA